MRRVSTNPAVGAELVPMFRVDLQLDGVGPGSQVLAFCNTMTNGNYTAATMAAAKLLGADAFAITVPMGNDWMTSRSIVDAWKSSDLVIGLLQSTDTHWIYSDAHNEALDAGVRTLMIEEPEDILKRMFPTAENRQRVEAGVGYMHPAETIRITSDAGTDLTMSKKGRIGSGQYGYSDVDGRWNHWPSAFVSTAPVEESAEGTLVIDIGDVLLALGRYVESPIRLTFHEGLVTAIEGGTDARLMRDFFEAVGDKDAYRVSHVGWGCEKRALWNTPGLRFWEGGGVMDVESFYGNVLFAFGQNFFRMLGGSNHVGFHLDVPMRNLSFWVDDTQVMDRGRFTIAGLE